MATINGNVVLNGGLISGASVAAYDESGPSKVDEDTTGVDGTYSLTVSGDVWVGVVYVDGGGVTYSTPFEYVPIDVDDAPAPPTNLTLAEGDVTDPAPPTNLTLTET